MSQHELIQLIEQQPKPVCTALTPFTVLEARSEGYVKLEFAPQPAFENHFGHIQGGFAVSMMDVLISLAAFAHLRQWIPTVEIKTSFIAPAKIAVCIGEGSVIRAGRNVTFVEGKLWNSDGSLTILASATLMAAKS